MPSTYGSEGVVYAKYADMSAEMETSIKTDLGDSINMDRDSFFGYVRDMVASAEAQANEIDQQVYDAGSIQNSSGATLDGNVGMVGMVRTGDTYSTIESVAMVASKACTVPAGTVLRTSITNVKFATDEEVVFPAAGTRYSSATCTVPGPVNVAIGHLNKIVNSIPGLTSVSNTTAAVPGTYRQTDAQVKVTHDIVTATSGDDDAAGILEALYAIPVTKARVIDNDTDTVSTEDGITPAHNIRVIVIGGSDADVAEAIWLNKTTGIPTFGSETVTVYNDTYGYTKDINFDRGSLANTSINITITKFKNFPDDGELLIEEAIAVVFDAYTLGSTVNYGQLLGACYSVPGVQVDALTIFQGFPGGTSGSTDMYYDPDQLPDLGVERDDSGAITSINIGWFYS